MKALGSILVVVLLAGAGAGGCGPTRDWRVTGPGTPDPILQAPLQSAQQHLESAQQSHVAAHKALAKKDIDSADGAVSSAESSVRFASGDVITALFGVKNVSRIVKERDAAVIKNQWWWDNYQAHKDDWLGPRAHRWIIGLSIATVVLFVVALELNPGIAIFGPLLALFGAAIKRLFSGVLGCWTKPKPKPV